MFRLVSIGTGRDELEDDPRENRGYRDVRGRGSACLAIASLS